MKKLAYTLISMLILSAPARAIVPFGTAADPLYVSCSLGQSGSTPITMTSTLTITGTDGGGVSFITSGGASVGGALTVAGISTLGGDVGLTGGLTASGAISGLSLAGSGAAITALTPANFSAGTLPANVIASSVAVNKVGNAQMAAATYSNITVPAANVAAGSLGASVISSSVALAAVGSDQLATNSVTDVKIVSMAASKLTGDFSPVPHTKAELLVLVPASAGKLYYCSDCTLTTLAVSTGALAGQVSDVSARTAVIQ